MFLFIDCETTGLPLDLNESFSNVEAWPRLVQLGYILTNEEGGVIRENNLIIRPDNFLIPAESENIHSISTEKALEEGISVSKVFRELNEVISKAKILIGHNIRFDKKIIESEIYRNDIDISFDGLFTFCTMRSSRSFCQIKTTNGFKWPALVELYNGLKWEVGGDEVWWSGSDLDFHNAGYDVRVTKWCFFKLLELKKIRPMEIDKQINAIRAYLEMLSQADNISNKQIQLFSEKIEILFSTLEGFDLDELGEDFSPKETVPKGRPEIDDSFDDMDDDLPF